ncbi:unnamed protein product [Phytomonas sp. EM1]|nr:unnamed protein product [Phytomonas sp. EM1]|eukprot:CCW63444.1 unnamed protein product [Phytomonas sp. isolate EM1]
MSSHIQRLLLGTFVRNVSNSRVIQRFAGKLARQEHTFTGETMRIWAGATAKEIQSDLNNVLVKLFPKKSAEQGTTEHTEKIVPRKENCGDRKR